MTNSDRPYFLWDYNLNETQVRQILSGSNETDRRWLLARILTSAAYKDVWTYTNLEQITSELPHLKLRPYINSAWTRALHAWGYHVQP